ncbi:MAG: hydrogenase nickel incorporation protein HypB [Candidatus Zapsychrus exili]|nr:hydrogenase nickel incorporation protein HypB [Candidatus Zapsychrus exili]
MANISVVTKKRILDTNDQEAAKTREAFKEAGLFAVNLISSPGSGKTTLLEKTIEKLNPEQNSAVIVGDLETSRDAERVAPFAKEVVQINTGLSCHLYANQIQESLKGLNLSEIDFCFIENVGNMVCPGEFDLGENAKIILLSTPEGDDKVAKYPTIFRAADLVLLTKCDLLKVLDFNMDRVKEDIYKLNSNVKIIELSSLSGQGMEEWLSWLKDNRTSFIGAKAKFVTE